MSPSNEALNAPHHAHEEEDDEDAGCLDDDDFSDTSAHLLDEDPIKAKFEQDIEAAHKLSCDLQNSEACDKKNHQAKFVNERFSEWHKTTEEGRNFLHILADYDYRILKPTMNLQWLMWRAIRKLPPHLLWSPDSNKRIPLTSALLKNNSLFGWSVVLRMKDATSQEYKTLLQKTYKDWDGSSETTCLHAAAATCIFDNGDKRKEFFSKMCDFAPQELFHVKDTKRRTPLHRAVDYECCCSSQVEVVKELLRSCSGLLDVSIQDPEDFSRNLSVYQYHHLTQKKFLESRRRRAQNIASQEPNAGAPKKTEPKQERGVDPKKDPKGIITRAEKSGPEKTSMGPPPPREKGEASLKRRGSIAATPKDTPTPLQSPSLTPITRAKTGAVSRGTRTEVVQNPTSKEKEMEDAAKAISNLLKLEILRKQVPEKAAESLRLQHEPGE
ncbi:hypothetical protein IL306_010179 [Fusarium sp. DS 682]|nr:hypothetical protein IL306_010179 [Fusarium sp. DS 682]